MKEQLISKVLFGVAACIFLYLPASHAQVMGSSHPFIEKEIACWNYHSAIVQDNYTIYIHVPPGYDTTKIKYPVLYITDGDWDKNDAINSFNMLRQDYITREAVIVCIGYGEGPNQRNRDFEPNGGGPRFLAFIEKELIPFVESKYRVTDDRTLSGYSYGGRFATYVLFNRPGLFNNICIGAPGTSIDLVPSAKRYFASHKDLKTRIFLGVGSYEEETASNMQQFKKYLLGQNCKDLEVEFRYVLQASHGAAKPKVIQDGVEFAFCKTHKQVNVSADELEKYTGTYVFTHDTSQKVTFYLENGKLYLKDSGWSYEFVPFTKDGGFFVHGMEKSEMYFRTENGKMYELYIPYQEKPLRFDKVN